ncbi:MAG: N-acetylglucosamine-6-phosphate deacetylase [Armatimonadota bacterium]|nr:N-acetylglucosamine-6-phosphate deacetylase [Armatimonadota bacterium]
MPDLVVQADTLVLSDGMRGPGHVTVAGGRIAAVGLGRHPRPDVDAAAGMLAPGFVDLQINGAAGADFLSPTDSGLRAAQAYLLRTGTVAYLPTLVSAPEPRLRAALDFFASRISRPAAPRILGVHLEGPFLSPARPGAHAIQHLRRPSVEWIARLVEAFPGVIRVVTLAPELDGAGEVIDYLGGVGIVTAAGHTDATYAQAVAAFDRGVRLATHVFNAMRPYHHREPGVVGAALCHPAVTCSLIVDHVHLHPAVVKHVLALKGPDRVALVTDAISAAGAPPGQFTLGERVVRVADGAPRLDDGTLGGSVLAMDQAVRHAARAASTDAAVRMAATTPARLLGLSMGELRVGLPADLVVLDQDLSVRIVIVAGEIAYRLEA